MRATSLIAPPSQVRICPLFHHTYVQSSVHFNVAVRYIGSMKFVFAWVTASIVFAAAGSVVAQERRVSPEASKTEQSSAMLETTSKRAGISVRQAIALAQQDTGGRVLSSKSFNGGAPDVQIHQIRLLVEDERVITVIVGADGRVRPR